MARARMWLLDDDKTRGLPARSTWDIEEARRANRQRMAVYWCPNLPIGEVRRIDRLTGVRFAYVDLDDGNKADQLAALLGAPCEPCCVVETKRGYQAYWRIDGLDVATWDAVERHRLVPYFSADPRATDAVRLLRVPGFLHQKQPDDPFLIRVVHRSSARHPLARVLDAFPEVHPAPRAVPRPRPLTPCDRDDIIAAVAALDARTALERVSGTSLVRGERFTFRPTTRGRLNIVVDDRCTSCFVDEVGRIGGGGGLGAPTAVQWIAYYYGGKPTTSDWRAIAAELRVLFPELDAGGRRAA